MIGVGQVRAPYSGAVEACDDVSKHEAAVLVALGAVHTCLARRPILARIQYQDALHSQLQLHAEDDRSASTRPASRCISAPVWRTACA